VPNQYVVITPGYISSGGGSGYPRRKILSGESIELKDEETWTIYQQLDIANTGELILDGEVVIII